MIRCLAALVLALAASTFARGDALDPSARIAYLSYVEGQITFDGLRGRASSALPDRPLLAGDRIVTGDGSRAELSLGAAIVRLDQRTELAVLNLGATAVRLELKSGSASVHLWDVLEVESFEIATSNTVLTLDATGEYRVDVRSADSVALTVREGSATAATSEGPVRVASGQRVVIEGSQALARLHSPPAPDAFDDWILERELRLAAADPLYRVPDYDTAVAELDHYGDWYSDSFYGRVWAPNYTGYWDPFYHGAWQHTGVGWSWIHSGPWGFFAFQGGNWTYLNDLNRWCWVPRPTPHTATLAQDTRPFGHARGRARSTGADGGGPAISGAMTTHRFGKAGRHDAAGARAGGSTIFRSFGGGSRSQPGASGGSRSVGTMRPSGSSYGRSSSSSSRGSSSVFAGPGGS